MSITRRVAVAAAVASALLLSACAAAPQQTPSTAPTVVDTRPLAELGLLDDPRAYVGESTAVLGAQGIEPVTGAAAPSFPVTVTSHDLDGDRQVTVDSADAVIGLDIAGSIGATIFGLGLGDRVVARDVSTTFAEAADLPVITTDGHSVNTEAIIALRPDLVITDGTIGPIDVLLQLRDAGITVVFVDTDPSLDGVGELARQVAAALGSTEAGDQLAARLDSELAAKVAEIGAIAPTGDQRLRMIFLYLRGSAGIYYLFGEESGADVLITSLGGIDVAGEIGWDGMKPMTDEALIAANPDLILVMTDGLSSVGGVDGLLESKPAIALTLAGQHRRFVDMADGDILSFGPRTPAVLDALARAIYAPVG
jgi:iron complex transport system substrate-binding protein